jgi:hypothetical protein
VGIVTNSPSDWSIPEWLANVLKSFDGMPSAFSESQILDAIRGANPDKDLSTQATRSALNAEWSAFAVHHRRGKHDATWPGHFQPMAVWHDESGVTRISPDIQDGGKDRLAYWSVRLRASNHPVLRARYADLRWDLSHFIGGQRAERQDADAAIDAYLAAVDLADPGLLMDSDARLSRSLELAMLVGDTSRQERVVDTYLQFVDQHRKPGRVGTWCGLMDDLLLRRKRPPLTIQQVHRIVAIAEEELARASSSRDDGGMDVWSAESAATRLASYYERADKREDKVRVLAILGGAFEQHAGRSDPMVAVHFLDRAKKTYSELRMVDAATRVQKESLRQGKLAEGQLTPIEASVKIKKEDRERYLDAMTVGGLPKAIERFAVNFLQKKDRTLSEIRELEGEFVSQRLMPRKIIDNGHVIAVVGNLQDDPEGRLIHGVAQSLQLRTLWMSWVIDRLRERYSPTVDDVWAVLSLSPVFQEERKPLIAAGIRAYFDADYTKTIHVLIPQIEHAMLVLLSLLPGKTINKSFRDEKRGVMQFKTLSDILDDEDVATALGPDLHLHLVASLCHPKGLNLRNRVCHGLCEPGTMARPWADVVLHCLIVLSLIRPEEK